MKKLAYVVVGLIALVVIVVGAAFVAINTLDWKPQITEAASEATGRTLRIDGDLEVALSPGLQLDFAAEGVSLANAAGLEPPEMLKLGAITGRVQLWPYLTRRAVVVDSLIVREPVVNLAVDASGRPNWVLAEEVAEAEPRRPSAAEGPPFRKLRIGELSLENGTFSYVDAVSGQTVQASEINVDFALTDLDTPLSVDAGMVLNKEPVSLKVEIDTPNSLLNGPEAKTVLALTTKHAKASYEGRVLRRPVDGLDGVFDVEIPSVGRLAAWLDRPLAKGQPDPGPLKVHAVFAGEGAKVTLKEARIEGQALKASASGSYDGSGEVDKLVLTVESDVLDIDRYLPPPKPQAATRRQGAPRSDPLAGLSDEPIDVSVLRRTDADVKLAIAGVKVAGFDLGRIDFTAEAKGGVLTADLARLALYGGAVSGKLTLDAKAAALGLTSEFNIDKVSMDRLAKAATGETPIAGIASGQLKATSQGKSPRALAKNMQGSVDFSLGEVKNAPVEGITAVNLKLDLPGLEKQPTLRGDLVYNKQKVEFGAATDPVQKLLESDSFKADVKLSSTPLSLTYSGAVQRRPVPGLDGRFDLDVPSVAVLAAWLGQPLDKGQPDPGPLKVSAEMATEGDSFLLKQASITGKALQARASGSFRAEKPVPRFEAKIDVIEADLNAYLPPEQKRQAAAPAPAAASEWSREPYGLSGLKAANGTAEVALAKIRYRNLEIAKGRVTAALEGGVFESNVESLELAGGTLGASARLDASGETAQVAYKASVKGVEARPLLVAFAGSDRLSGTANIEAEGTSRGRSEWDLVNALNGKGSFTFLNGAIHGINLAATLRKARTLGMSQEAGEQQQTDFAELSGSYVITKGVVDNRDLKMLAPLVRLSGAGEVPMPPRTIDYTVEAKLVATLKGQGGQDALAGVPIPIRVTGSWEKPEYRVNWDSVIKSIAADPERLANMPKALGERAQDLGIQLPGGELLKGITGGATTQEQSGDTGSTSSPIQKPLDALKGLLKK